LVRPEASLPYLRFKGLDEGSLREMLSEVLDGFSRVAAVPQEAVKIELLLIALDNGHAAFTGNIHVPTGAGKTR
jgi:hypothetical protein